MLSFISGIFLVFCIGIILGKNIHKTLFIKLLTAFSFVFLFYKFSFSVQFFIFAFLTFFLIYASVIDYFQRIIPVIAPILLVITGILLSFINISLGELIYQD
jgi:leader peptidase (prepilin peptidase)/N-methyltransferase